MHELSLAAGILNLVEEAAARERFVQVERLVLEAGALAGVEVPALRFALESVAPGTLLEGARIEIEQPPGRALCLDCRESVKIEARGGACPRCGGGRLQPDGGTGLRLRELVVRDRRGV